MARTWAEDISGKTFALFGDMLAWPAALGRDPVSAIAARGGKIAEKVDKTVDFVALGNGRGKGRADAERKATTLGIPVLDEAKLAHLLRPSLDGAKFAFTGGFELLPDVTDPGALIRDLGASVGDLDENTDWLVIGEKRAAGKTATLNKAKELLDRGLIVTSERQFLELVRSQRAPGASRGAADLVVQLHSITDVGRIKRAIDMLKHERHKLYAEVTSEHVAGIIRSQTSDKIYSSALHADGRYACCTADMEPCLGLQGVICKHILVLSLGLVQAGELDAGIVETWLREGRRKPPADDDDTLAHTLFRYKLAESGEIDWRPTETLPEDFYAL